MNYYEQDDLTRGDKDSGPPGGPETCAPASERNAYTLRRLTEAVRLPKATTIRLCSRLSNTAS